MSEPSPPGAGARWDAAALADPHAARDKASRVEAMFDAIAPTYERVNRVLTFGRDAQWRRRAIAAAQIAPDDVVLDLCCGTGDMLRAIAALPRPPRRLLGADFSSQMLAMGRYPADPPLLLRADAQRLPLRNASVDVITCAFGVRNLQNLDAGLREMRRVMRPKGRLVILEFALPERAAARVGYRLYTSLILPVVGTLISRDRTGAYRYLPRSIERFGTRREMCARIAAAGFAEPATTAMNLGSVVVYCAEPC